MAKNLTPTDIDSVQRPVEMANGLANAHYIDPQVFAEESEAVLKATWAGLAVGADVPNPGNAKPISFLGIPLLLLRDQDGDLRVFENICRHRGMQLVSEAKTIEGAIRCPYHSWCYSTKGMLVSTPHVGGAGHNTHPSIVKEDLGLNEVRSHVWRDVVFINISGTAPKFTDVHADLIARWTEFDCPIFHGGDDSKFDLELTANYKLVVENYCESYHLPWVHPGLNSYSRLEDHYNIVEYGKFSGQGTLVYRQFKAEDGSAAFPDFPKLSEQWNEGAEYITVYPNVLLGVQRDHAFAIVLEPKAHNKTVEHIHLYYASETTDAKNRSVNTEQWKEVFAEDIFVVQGMQSGRYAPTFDGGRFSPVMDEPTHCYHDWVARKIATYRG
jgi:phenylpropionate dioxygenase-like ring-hydroxylating dioxygenase large terminal subunit